MTVFHEQTRPSFGLFFDRFMFLRTVVIYQSRFFGNFENGQ
jgi:hypothetical protein